MTSEFSDLTLLAIGTVTLVWLSRKALRRPGRHGFYRFFAWEAILAVIVLHRDLDGGQIISQTLLLLSLLLLALGYGGLRMRGQAAEVNETAEVRDDHALYAWEKTTALITHGIYGQIRHPMYSSLLALDWGMFFRAASLPGLVFATLATFFLLRTALSEEQECLAYFGEPYLDYMQKTRRFIPFVY